MSDKYFDQHHSRKATQAANYDELRKSGLTKEHARRVSEEASVKTHRLQDRLNSDRRR